MSHVAPDAVQLVWMTTFLVQGLQMLLRQPEVMLIAASRQKGVEWRYSASVSKMEMWYEHLLYPAGTFEQCTKSTVPEGSTVGKAGEGGVGGNTY